jgi:hypothetical protein
MRDGFQLFAAYLKRPVPGLIKQQARSPNKYRDSF